VNVLVKRAAPTIAFSPILRYKELSRPEPMDAPLHTLVFSTFPVRFRLQSSAMAVARGYTSLMKVTLWPIKTLSSISTPSQINVWLETLQQRPTLDSAEFRRKLRSLCVPSRSIQIDDLKALTSFPSFTLVRCTRTPHRLIASLDCNDRSAASKNCARRAGPLHHH